MKAKKEKLINVTLVGLIGKDVKGLRAQVRNPIYLNGSNEPCWRTLTKLETFKENGKHWVQLKWERAGDDSCNFTGSTIESDRCTIQFEESEFAKLRSIKK